MKFHDPISTEAGKQLIQLTAAGVFYTYALENRKKIGGHSKTLLGAKARVAYRIKQKVDELEVRMFFFAKDIEQLKKELEKLQME
ncbi:hypothetical protein K7G91_000897 [Pasteurella canis]|uniref:hypothetical protein n=1 Tax=Pasteurella canis TaxID=753 RepID=UPI000AA19ECE|nr:hypothetical protein [Pasteurella canis]UDW84611.1 hypothetical protein K7G91_000897 [Pasteurella canis]